MADQEDSDDLLLQELLRLANRSGQRQGEVFGQYSRRLADRQELLRQLYRLSQLRTGEMDILASPDGVSIQRGSYEPLLGCQHEPNCEASELSDEILSDWRLGLAELMPGNAGVTPPYRNIPSNDSQSPVTPTVSNWGENIWRNSASFILGNWRKFLLIGLAVAAIFVVEEHGSHEGIPHDPKVDRFSRFLTCAKSLTPRANMDDYHSPEYKAVDWLREQSELELSTSASTCPTWDSSFGAAYAMYLIRHHLGFADWDLDKGVSGICTTWKRVHCDAHGHVTQLAFNNANLTGNIATEIGGLVNLEHLILNTNHHLGGSLPSEIGTLTKLQWLHVQQTRISGEVPTQLGHLTALEQLMLYDTDLYGTVPEEVCALTTSGRLDNVAVSCHSALQCPCATHCKNPSDGGDWRIEKSLVTKYEGAP